MQTNAPTDEPLWRPTKESIERSELTRFQKWLLERHKLDLKDHRALYDWSVNNLEQFWSAVAEFFGVRFYSAPRKTLENAADPVHAKWFPGATLNYAEHLLRFGQPVGVEADDSAAVLFAGEPDRRETLTRHELTDRVARLASALRQLGVQRGDRIAAYLPNRTETLIAFLATASIGAIWSNCPAELSSRGVLDRFTQIEPKILFAVQGYRYGGKDHDRRAAVKEIVAGLPTLEHVIVFSDTDEPVSAKQLSWAELLRSGPGQLSFEPVPFDHPLWIVYSSGTTGTPKPIVHGHGGSLLELLKALAFHLDLRSGDRFFWFTSAGWMMWNLLLAGLGLGTEIVLYDGSPRYPDFSVLWDFIAKERIQYFGTSAPFLLACMKEGLEPRNQFDLSALRSIGSTGAPLPSEGFRWVYEKVKPEVWLGSISGGTDMCTAFVLSHPWLPVYAGKLQCRGLGAPIEAWDESGKPVWNQVGELVVKAPMPCMPVFFWNDTDSSRFRAAYFDYFPGYWRHGDWIEIDAETGQCVIYGRSDSTLNRGGVRMGTSEFYRVIESVPEVVEALVIDTTSLTVAEQDGQLLLFVVLREGESLTPALKDRICSTIKSVLSPRYVPDAVYAVPEIPHTLNGKKLEVPIKRIFQGTEPEKAVTREAMSNPDALKPFVELAKRVSGKKL
jgi:acetoacetyl-CoA synthetase